MKTVKLTDLPAEELVVGIENALKAHDVKAVGVLLRALIVVDPRVAEKMYATLKTAVDLADRLAPDKGADT